MVKLELCSEYVTSYPYGKSRYESIKDQIDLSEVNEISTIDLKYVGNSFACGFLSIPLSESSDFRELKGKFKFTDSTLQESIDTALSMIIYYEYDCK